MTPEGRAALASEGQPRRAPSLLFHGDSSDPEMLYFSRFNIVDPFLAFSVGSKKIGVAPALEYGRMVKESDFDEILLLSEVREGAAQRFGIPKGRDPDTSHLVRHLAAVHGIPFFRVGPRFPIRLARALREAGIRLEIACEEGGLFPERQNKSAAEVAALRLGNRACEAGFRYVAQTLAQATVRGGKLVHGGRSLTAERLRAGIAHAALDAGSIALQTIVAPGDQACDNHCIGEGPIRAGELIVVDIFPRRMADGYWGDMTRTYLKGRASDAQRRMVRTVREAHRLATTMIRPGLRGGKAHEAVQEFFTRQGYETVRDSRDLKGFFHALGHGVGLEIHEAPVMRAGSSWKFRKGMVVTVEPGLYYRGLGGVRIEDVVHVVEGGNEMLSKASYRWEIP